MHSPVPSYELYGETRISRMPDILHCESIAERSRLHGGNIKPHRHHGLTQILYSECGSVDATMDDRLHRLRGRFLIGIPALAVHAFRISADTEGWVITVPTANLSEIFAAAPRLHETFDRPLIFRDDESGFPFARASELLRQVEAEFRGTGAGRQFALRSALGLLMVLIAREAAFPEGGGLSIKSRRIEKLARFRELVELHFRDHQPLAAYAAELGVTTTQLNRICRQITGKSALQVVHDRVLIEAKRDLVYSEMSIGEVAAILGFRDPAYFTRFFQRNTGQPPAHYRRDLRAELIAGSNSGG